MRTSLGSIVTPAPVSVGPYFVFEFFVWYVKPFAGKFQRSGGGLF